jgi:shikimate 5-dehydrogenase
MKINKDTLIYASFSSNPSNLGCLRFNNAFEKNGINAIYKSFACYEIEKVFEAAETLNIAGFALSMPLKTQAKEYLRKQYGYSFFKGNFINNINTVSHQKSYCNTSYFIGYNTDVLGIEDYLKENEKILNNYNSYVFIIGCGAFAQSAEYVFKNLGYNIFFKNSRDTDLNINESSKTKDSIVFNASPRIIKPAEIDPSIFFIDCNTNSESGRRMSFLTARHQFYDVYGYDKSLIFEEVYE